ncbi:pyridoxal-dependent decarboxylase [Sphingomonas sp. AP4-R1]|uniref:pyridoxal phosphate-dependent decarboxylase family protein n=1 Tax=Sphingomonas sp. AP4-R1 TaxID=2735134 RepID=UPI0020A413B4|nr:pyridoxal-dependent decarboxylase [Sphingomonas sp. AP4-R1]
MLDREGETVARSRPVPALSPEATTPSATLDPQDWGAVRRQGHRMLDDMFDHLEGLAQQPVWQCAPDHIRAAMRAPLPIEPVDLAEVHAGFRETILPYGSGNIHPGFMGWVQGGGTPVGMLAEMLAGGLNANLGGRDHMPIAVEQQIVAWMREIFGFPSTADGLFLTGTSQANFVALLIARTRVCGSGVRTGGVRAGDKLVAYASEGVHGCVPRAMEMAGIGSDNLRRVLTNERGQIDLAALRRQIVRDEADGFRPFLIVGTAGTVNVGAVDDLAGLARIAAEHRIHFHIDGALGALGILSDELAPLFDGIELCDSLAFDFHKWGQVPYDAGFLLVRDGAWQRETFASPAAYLTRAKTGLAAGEWWPCDTGPDLSRGFRALKTWFTLKTYGVRALGHAMAASCRLARSLAERIAHEPDLVLLAPVELNIVCFGYASRDALDDGAINARIVERLHAIGEVAPSLTTIGGKPAIRAAFVNHRTTEADVDRLVESVLAAGGDLLSRA